MCVSYIKFIREKCAYNCICALESYIKIKEMSTRTLMMYSLKKASNDRALLALFLLFVFFIAADITVVGQPVPDPIFNILATYAFW